MIKEVKDWYFRLNPVPSGIKRDREPTFSKVYVSGDLKDEYKMFLKGQYPSEEVYKKFFESISFKLNPEDTAFERQQGLVQKCTDTKAINRDSTDNGCYESDGSISGTNSLAQDTEIGISPNKSLNSTNFATSVLPHQLPNIQITDNVDGTDNLGTPIINNGLKLTPVIVTLPNSRTRKNFKLDTVLELNGNLEIGVNEGLTTKGYTGNQVIITGLVVSPQGIVLSYTTKTLEINKGIITNIV